MPNSGVRANAVALLIDVFPLQSDDSSAHITNKLLQRQFDAFKACTLSSSSLAPLA